LRDIFFVGILSVEATWMGAWKLIEEDGLRGSGAAYERRLARLLVSTPDAKLEVLIIGAVTLAEIRTANPPASGRALS
jgi:hypothetical protein